MDDPKSAALFVLTIAVASAVTALASAAEQTPVEAKHGLVVSVSRPASLAGLDVLKAGGNAVDAAVATAFALAVTYPEAGNIGGGGFMLVQVPGEPQPVCIDYRETAPRAATENMYAGVSSRLGHRIVGVPGTVRGLALAHQRFGKLPWPRLLEPAIQLAADGFRIDGAVADSLNRALPRSRDFEAMQQAYRKLDGTDWAIGDRLRQRDLAATLRRLAEHGADEFYRGRIAEEIVREMRRGRGIITAEDLAAYEAKVRPAIHGTFRGYDIYGPPPPSSGGIVLVETLNILENFELGKADRWSVDNVHLVIEAMKRAYCDRAKYLGDSDFVSVPEQLTSKDYARKLAAEIDRQHATPSAKLAPELTMAGESPSTTHFSVIDSTGMAVSNTYTLEQRFGSRVVVRGAGFLLNNEMGDFNWRPGYTDRKGAIGTPANVIAPAKRMLSSQTPTIVSQNGKVVLVTGSPGGRTIINTVLSIVLGMAEFGMDGPAAVAAPRFHHGWFPDEVEFEGVERPEFQALVEGLKQRGHQFAPLDEPQGDAHTIWVRGGASYGVPDRRISGYAAGY